ncbi:CvfB family protein [Brevibacillus daliensis]|uniref:CvfB family protein n=1 Tax=Brevibacillus daliensis TaxID=2892995 RepID=UPI001E44C341|nr:S1-like domain-containing RNA-binding protein [Brevibacillus daliensis]
MNNRYNNDRKNGAGKGYGQGGNRYSSRGGYNGRTPFGRNQAHKETKPMPAQSSWLKAGMIATLPVARAEEFGYFLSDGEQEFLLHKNEAVGEVHAGDEVKVFMYHDHENRLAATMEMPIVREGEFGWLEVVDISPRVGVFLHNGINKDLLLFQDDLPKEHSEWPQKGDKLLVTLKHDKVGRLVAQPATEEDIWDMSRNAYDEMKNQWVEGTVYKLFPEGAFVFTDEKQMLFIHRDEITTGLRMGQRVRARISFVREDGRLNGSMRERKEVQYGVDAQVLLGYLKERGAMPFTDKSDPEEIKEQFQMSKAAFKRALGKLLKEGLVEQEEGWTHLKKDAYQRYQGENNVEDSEE